MKDHLRFLIGHTLKALGASGIVRTLYLKAASGYVNQASPYVKGAWVRRSLTTADFTPLSSDIDLTVLIDLDSIADLMKNRLLFPRFLIHDVQIIAAPFYSDWELTGGFRNRQISSWIPLNQDTKIQPPPLLGRSEIAFELAHEIYLLWEQLAPRLSSGPQAAVKKLGLELDRLFDFWQSLDSEILCVPRERFFTPELVDDFPAFLHRQEKFWSEVLAHLKAPMDSYQLAPLEDKKYDYGSTLFLEIRKKKVFMLKDFSLLEKAKHEFHDHFIATPAFIRLLKGSGVQEQTLLNRVAITDEYYRRFCKQRLAHDLIGTLLQDPDNQRRLYYCFRNNQEFFEALSLGTAPGWNELKALPEGSIPWDYKQLLSVSLRNLEVLGRLG